MSERLQSTIHGDGQATTAPVAPDQRALRGPFDIVGDVHGCFEELHELLAKLGYHVPQQVDQLSAQQIAAPEGRRVVFVGDFVDRGPRSMMVLKLVMTMVESGHALAVLGNHDDKFWRWLQGRKVSVAHGLAGTIAEFEQEPSSMRAKLLTFFATLPAHLWLDSGRLVVAHAGIQEAMLGKTSKQVRQFCLYGDTGGERDSAGLPIRYHWAAGYRGKTAIIYGHTAVPKADWVNQTLCIDTGCCFGGQLTALRWPERDIVSVAARKEYTPRLRPLGHPPVRPHRTHR